MHRRIGLTGSIGAGKSTVARLLRSRGFTVLDADEQARAVTRQPEVLRELEAAFAGVVVGGELQRQVLARRVFGDAAQLARLNVITHPRVREKMAALEQAAVALGARCVIQDIPLLFEGDQQGNFEAVWLVDAPLEVRVGRVMARDGLSREAVLARDARQMPAEQKRRLASAVLENSGSEEHLAQQLEEVIRRLNVQP